MKWKDVKGYEGLYKISNTGILKSLDRQVEGKLGSTRTIFGKEISATDDGKGYLKIALYKDGIRKLCKIHKLVAEHFVPNPENKYEVNHKDGIKTNNDYTNLEWATTQENCIHRQVNGLGNIEEANKARMRPVAKINLKTGAILKKYSCIREASDELNCKLDAIGRVARGERKSYLGFGWKFI